MKHTLLLLTLAFSPLAHAGFEAWTSSDGRTATMNLLSVADVDGEKVGRFSLRSGKIVEVKASQLSEEDGKRLSEWKPAGPAAAASGPENAFGDVLDGNLVRLDGKRLRKCDDATKPAKYYVFYYTASWCGPCQAYTPSLVKWYNENKNDNFELVLITWDQDKRAMEGYAADKKMPWPLLELRKADDFQEKFPHKVTGIPSVITCDLEGNIVSRTESPVELTKLVK